MLWSIVLLWGLRGYTTDFTYIMYQQHVMHEEPRCSISDTIDVKESENFSTRNLKSDGGVQSIFNFQKED
jgi:hypothetical protein